MVVPKAWLLRLMLVWQKIVYVFLFPADCDIATENPIQNLVDKDDEGLRKCIIVLPNIQGYINRIYMTLRRINLPDSMRLKVNTQAQLSTKYEKYKSDSSI